MSSIIQPEALILATIGPNLNAVSFFGIFLTIPLPGVDLALVLNSTDLNGGVEMLAENVLVDLDFVVVIEQ